MGKREEYICLDIKGFDKEQEYGQLISETNYETQKWGIKKQIMSNIKYFTSGVDEEEEASTNLHNMCAE